MPPKTLSKTDTDNGGYIPVGSIGGPPREDLVEADYRRRSGKGEREYEQPIPDPIPEPSAYEGFPGPAVPEPRVYGRLNLDVINDYLDTVAEDAKGSGAATMATAAIKHFYNLLEICAKLSAAVEFQTNSLRQVLETDLASVSEPRYRALPDLQQPFAPVSPQYDNGFNTPPPQDPAFQAVAQWPEARPVPPGPLQPWKVTPDQVAARARQAMQNQQPQVQMAPVQNQDPAYQAWLAAGSPQANPGPQYQNGPTRNGAVIQASGGFAALMDAISAPPPQIASGFGGSPMEGGPKGNIRYDRV
jgi:hypothetical protein